MQTETLEAIKKQIVRANSTLVAKACPKGNYHKKIEESGKWIDFEKGKDIEYTPPMDFDPFRFRAPQLSNIRANYLLALKGIMEVPKGLKLTKIGDFCPYIQNNSTKSGDIKLTIKKK